MNKIKITIIGGSISGSVLAYLLAREGYEVRVYEQKKQKDIGNKLCANIVTKSFLKYIKNLGISPKEIIESRFEKAVFLLDKEKFVFPVEDYKINRQKFIDLLIKKSKKAGVKFYFGKKIKEINFQDIIIGADGAFSMVAKKKGLWQKRKFAICTQITCNGKIKNLKINKKNYYVFLDKNFGYYSYVFPSKRKLTIGNGEFITKESDKPSNSFDNFLSFLNIRKSKKEVALIPLPKVIKTKKDNIFLTGDAACFIKFNGGGIIPAIEGAFALADLIKRKDYSKIRKLQNKIFVNSLVTKLIQKIKYQNLEYFLKIVEKDKKLRNLIKERDNISMRHVKYLFFKPKLIYFLIRALVFS